MPNKKTPVEFDWPRRGFFEGTAHRDQPAVTTQQASNVVTRDPLTGRRRGASRSGISKYTASAIGANYGSGAAAIDRVQDMEFMIRSREQITRTLLDGNSGGVGELAEEWAETPPTLQSTRYVAIDLSGRVYAVVGNTEVACYQPDGTRGWIHSFETDDPEHLLQRVVPDNDEDEPHLYIAMAGRVATTKPGWLGKYRITPTGLEQVWRVDAPDGGVISDFDISGGGAGDVIVFTENKGGGLYLVYRYDGALSSSPIQTWARDETGGGFLMDPAHCRLHPSGDIYVGGPGQSSGFSPGKLMKYSSVAGDRVWTSFIQDDHVGWGIVIDDDGVITSLGTDGNLGGGAGTAFGGNAHIARWIDTTRWQSVGGAAPAAVSPPAVPSTVGTSPTNWGFDTTRDLEFIAACNLASGRDGGVYVVGFTATNNPFTAYRYDHDASGGGSVSQSWQWKNDNAANAWGGTSIAVDPRVINTDLQQEFVVVGSDYGSTNSKTVARLNQYKTTIGSGSAREAMLWLAGHDNANSRTEIIGYNIQAGSSTPEVIDIDTDATQYMSGTDKFVYLHSAFEQVFATDGEGYVWIDTKGSDAGNSQSKVFKATKGQIPKRCKIISSQFGRLIFARPDTNPRELYFSNATDYRDFDYAPLNPTEATAVAATIPDVVNAVIPYEEDILILGGDTSIWMYAGDPGTGVQPDRLPVRVGIAFGKAWTIDDRGNLYFYGAEGGFYRMRPRERSLERLSERRLDLALAGIDLTKYKVTVEYDYRQQHVILLFRPFDVGADGTKTGYIYDIIDDAFWPIDFGNANYYPWSQISVAGDMEDDKHTLLGCDDGYVRYWNKNAQNDDSTAITSEIVMGPFIPGGLTNEQVLTGLQGTFVIAGGGSSVAFEVYGEDLHDFDSGWTAKITGTWQDGYNQTINERSRGRTHFVRLALASATSRWSMESIAGKVEPFGKSRGDL